MSSGEQRRPLSPGRSQGGFTYVAALFAVALIGLFLSATGELWSHARQREKERELQWIGNQFRQAIALYYHRTPGALKRYPEKLEDLLEDKRHLNFARYLRRLYDDPMTGKPEWGLVSAPGGGVMGIYSLSERAPIKMAGFGRSDSAFAGRAEYSDWKFVYEPPTTAAPRR